MRRCHVLSESIVWPLFDTEDKPNGYGEDQPLTRLLFISTKNRWFFRLTLLTSLIALVLFMLSAYSRLYNTAPACPDWPQCFGSLMVPHTLEQINTAAAKFPQLTLDTHRVGFAMLERSLIAAESALLLILTLMAASIKRQISVRPLLICLMLLGLGVAQIFLNKYAIKPTFSSLMIVGNLLNELAILSLLWWIALITRPNTYSFSHPSLKSLRPWAWLALLFIVLQITFGGWLNSHDVELNCNAFPYCNVKLTPTIDWQKTLHVSPKNSTPDSAAFLHSVHRVGALCAFAYLALFSFLLLFNRYIYHIAFIILTLLSAQFYIGMFDISWLPTTAFLSETALLACLLLAVVSLLTSLYDRPQDYWYG
jgi:cytochrome c oxidase assembly protein subunit 15